MAVAVVSRDGISGTALVPLIASVLAAPYASSPAASTAVGQAGGLAGSVGSFSFGGVDTCGGGRGLWDWDAHMHIAAGLAAALDEALAPGASADATAAGASLAETLAEAGVGEALLAVVNGAEAAQGGFGRCHRLLLRNALASLVALVRLAPGSSVIPRLRAAGGASAAASAASRYEIALDPPAAGGSSVINSKAWCRSRDHCGMFPGESVPHGRPEVSALLASLAASLA